MNANNNSPCGIRKIGIIGEGKMGSNIFNYLLDFDLSLILICSRDTDPEIIHKSFQKRIKRKLEAGLISREQYDLKNKEISISGDLQQLTDRELLIEAIPEAPEQKMELFRQIDAITNSNCIFTSNSSSINPTRLIPSSRRKETTAGMHFFYPVGLKNIIELIFPISASIETRKRLTEFAHSIQRKVLVLDEKNSFLLNRIFLDFQNEAYQLVKSGNISMKDLDNLVKTSFFPFGVFDFIDSVGLETMLTAIRNYTEDYPNKEYYLPLINALEEKIKAGRLGQKSGAGFYPDVESGETFPEYEPKQIIYHLRQTFLSSVKRFTMQSKCDISEMNEAVKEYFVLEKGPFEI